MASNSQHMTPQRDSASGQYMTEYDPDTFVEAISELGGSASTTEVADEVGCDRRTAHLRLTGLADRDVISGRRVGRAFLWNVSEDGI